MKEHDMEKEILDKIRDCLDRGVENLDDRTARALRSSRLEALDLLERKRRAVAIPRWLTAGGIASAVVLVVAVSMFYVSSRKSLLVKSADEFEMLNVTEQPEMYKDLEFYRWLAERNDAD